MCVCVSFRRPYRYVDELLYWSGRRMLLDEYLQGDLSPNRLPPTWVSRTKFVFQSDDGGLAVYETTNNSVKTLVTNHTLVSSFFLLPFHSTNFNMALPHWDVCLLLFKQFNKIIGFFLFLSPFSVSNSVNLTLRDINVQQTSNSFYSNTMLKM